MFACNRNPRSAKRVPFLPPQQKTRRLGAGGGPRLVSPCGCSIILCGGFPPPRPRGGCSPTAFCSGGSRTKGKEAPGRTGGTCAKKAISPLHPSPHPWKSRQVFPPASLARMCHVAPPGGRGRSNLRGVAYICHLGPQDIVLPFSTASQF